MVTLQGPAMAAADVAPGTGTPKTSPTCSGPPTESGMLARTGRLEQYCTVRGGRVSAVHPAPVLYTHQVPYSMVSPYTMPPLLRAPLCCALLCIDVLCFAGAWHGVVPLCRVMMRAVCLNLFFPGRNGRSDFVGQWNLTVRAPQGGGAAPSPCDHTLHARWLASQGTYR